MSITIGKEGAKHTWQEHFPEEVRCIHQSCAGKARLGFVFNEEEDDIEKHVYDLYENDPEGGELWLHDSCAVAVYFCRQCLEPTALFNQA